MPGPYATRAQLDVMRHAMRQAIEASVKRPDDECAAGCGVRLDPAARVGGYDRHPACEPGFVPTSLAEHLRAMNRAKRAKAEAKRGRRR